MTNPRLKIGDGKERILYAEVDGNCPLCTRPLQFEKQRRVYKKYEIAHIYPLNPTKKEQDTLKNELRLGNDVNDIENLILLCTECHEQFDKGRTVAEYQKVVGIKQKLIHQNQARSAYFAYSVEQDLMLILSRLYSGLSQDVARLSYSALKIDDKTNDSVSGLLKKRIKDDVSDYYLFIRDVFSEMEKNQPGIFDLIAAQIRSFYLKTKLGTNNQEFIFHTLSEWLNQKTEYYSSEACQIIISFFIQNCEVFS